MFFHITSIYKIGDADELQSKFFTSYTNSAYIWTTVNLILNYIGRGIEPI